MSKKCQGPLTFCFNIDRNLKCSRGSRVCLQPSLLGFGICSVVSENQESNADPFQVNVLMVVMYLFLVISDTVNKGCIMCKLQVE